MIVVPQRNAVLLAKELSTLDSLSGGRVTAGIGVGWNDGRVREPGDAADRFHVRGAYLDETIRLWRHLWSGATEPFHGRFHTLEDFTFGPRPVQDVLPILIGGTAEPALRRAGRLADGYHASSTSPARLAEMIPIVTAAATAAGRPAPSLSAQGARPVRRSGRRLLRAARHARRDGGRGAGVRGARRGPRGAVVRGRRPGRDRRRGGTVPARGRAARLTPVRRLPPDRTSAIVGPGAGRRMRTRDEEIEWATRPRSVLPSRRSRRSPRLPEASRPTRRTDVRIGARAGSTRRAPSSAWRHSRPIPPAATRPACGSARRCRPTRRCSGSRPRSAIPRPRSSSRTGRARPAGSASGTSALSPRSRSAGMRRSRAASRWPIAAWLPRQTARVTRHVCPS